jgi:hypothetical protein
MAFVTPSALQQIAAVKSRLRRSIAFQPTVWDRSPKLDKSQPEGARQQKARGGVGSQQSNSRLTDKTHPGDESMDMHHARSLVARATTAVAALGCLAFPAAAQAGNVFFGQCEGQFNGRLSSTVWGQQDFEVPISNGGSCTGDDGDIQTASGYNVYGGYGHASWRVSLTREIEFLAPGVFAHRGRGRARVTALNEGADNGTYFHSHPAVGSAMIGSVHRMFFTVDAPTPIKLKAQVTALLDSNLNSQEDSLIFVDGGTVLWSLSGTLGPGSVIDGELEHVLVPGRNYYLQFVPVLRAQVASCGSQGCSGNPNLYSTFQEDYTNWDYELTFNYTRPVLDLASLTLSKSEVAGCKSVTGRVTLTSPAPEGGFSVTLADTLAAAVTPAVVTVPAGALTKSFTIKTTPVAATESGNVSATGEEESLTEELSVRPIGLASVALTPTTVVGGNPVTGTATLECAAGPGPVLVDLSTTDAAVAAPLAATVFVPQGLKSETFTVATDPVLSKSSAMITGEASTTTKSRRLNVVPAAAVSPARLQFGSQEVGTTSATLSATLRNDGVVPFVVNSIGLTGAYASWFAQTNNCPASLPAGASCTIVVTFTPAAGLSKSAKLNIATTATATPLSVSLSGTGI